ncbi:hypothetical protein AGLY_013997 [Aphis glycines]|uniref:Uncharacterized protein n=1 Tax=Aphis glycines TaxID=307491 RepID=A0A6G0T644_APHGL|nr:hypothetical protein AGLY_013997 [Aphis glycines]
MTVLLISSFSIVRIYKRVDSNGKIVPRKLIIVINDNVMKAVCCTICIAFNTSSVLSNFNSGCTNFKNIYSAIEFHENKFVVNNGMMNKRKKQVFEIIKFIGKRNLSDLGTDEGLYDLEDLNMKRGNFLELLKFTANRDTVDTLTALKTSSNYLFALFSTQKSKNLCLVWQR